MDRVLAILRRKQSAFLYTAFAYLAGTALLKWNIHPTVLLLWYLVGGVLGIYFLDFAEEFFRLEPSPFKSAVFCGAFSVLALFIVTSSGNALAEGLVLLVYLTLLSMQIGQWRAKGELDSWFQMLAKPVMKNTQKAFLYAFSLLFAVITFFFVVS